jgi:hypothetical protein
VANEKIKHCAAIAGVSLALSLATVAAGAAAPRWAADPPLAAGAGFAAGAAAASPAPYGGYYDYAPGPMAWSYYDYYGDDDYVLARRAFPPGCGAGKPHC